MKIFSKLRAGSFASIEPTIVNFFTLFFARLSQKALGVVFLILCFIFFEFLFPNLSFALDNSQQNFSLTSPTDPITKSLFSEKTTYQTSTIAFSQKKIVDPTLNSGEEKVIVKGALGKKVTEVTTLFYKNQVFSKEEKVVENTSPVEEVVATGLPSDNLIATPFGNLSFSQKLNLWATAYDANCAGCSQTTSIGLKMGFGVVAVDPRVIPLKSRLYIPGYGLAIAGDTGGSIKGNKIDLGFENVTTSGWHAQFTDVYILD